MSFLQVRNTLINALSIALGIPIVLSDQVQPEVKVPFGIYSVTAPYISTAALGDHRRSVKGEEISDSRREQPNATFSFTFCSRNRRDDDDYTILGEDEAQELSEKAISWLQHLGYDELSLQGIVVVEVMNVGSRTTLAIDEAERRYGFDLRIRYTREDARTDPAIKFARLVEK